MKDTINMHNAGSEISLEQFIAEHTFCIRDKRNNEPL